MKYYWFSMIVLIIVMRLLLCNLNEREYFLRLGGEISINNVNFIENDDLYNILLNSDDFFSSFFDYDWKARKVNNLEEYKLLIKRSCSSFSEIEKEKVKTCCENVDNFFLKINVNGFDNIKASNIEWKLGRVKGREYEYGLPHTRGNDVIILGDENLKDDIKTLTRTLIHEKIHLYQKQNREEVEKYNEYNNIEKLKKREYNDYVRANPDLDGWIYMDKVSNSVLKCVYNSPNPESIIDVKNMNQKEEHPFERQATVISEMY